jgi:hypothetical protein
MDHKFTADLTSNQLGKDGTSQYATFLPAISNAFTTVIGRARMDPTYFAPSRIPQNFEHGVEGMNWLNPNEGYFKYRWSLYSAGHANLDLAKDDPGELMIKDRDRDHTWLLGDSGGFQIGKGVWEGDWKDPSCPKAMAKRRQVLTWLDTLMDYGMVLDIPVWVVRFADRRKKTGINSYADAVTATSINNEYFMQNRNGNCKFLNVLQGENHTQADMWYNDMKQYCDPRKHTDPFNGWGMGGQNMCDIELILKRLVALRHDGLLERGKQDRMHFLGTSKLEWAVLLTDIQRAIRKYHNSNFTITFDCASPFLAAANGQIYREIITEGGRKWTYRMEGGVDNKAYAKDTRQFKDVVLGDGLFKSFEDSPISRRCMIKDVCPYSPGDLNRIGKEGKTSWDTLTYGILMSHNAYMHIESVQRANRAADAGQLPSMLTASFDDHDAWIFKDIINEIFATSDRGRSLQLIHDHKHIWHKIMGTRGFTGPKALNTNTKVDQHFERIEA